MTKKILSSFVSLLLVVTTLGCGLKNQNNHVQEKEPDLKAVLEENCEQLLVDRHMNRIDEFIVIFDPSASMNEMYQGVTKFEIGKYLLTQLNNTLPNFDMVSGIRTFGSPVFTSMIGDMSPYDKKVFSDAIDNIVGADGVSPLEFAIEAVIKDFELLPGKKAVIIITDGKDMDVSSVNAAKKLQGEYDHDICIYSILVGDDAEGKEILSRISSTGACGFLTFSDELMSCENIESWVRKMFCQNDRDGDGVPDNEDGCPDNPEKIEAGLCGCDVSDADSDQDGVPDCIDNCPGTPENATVDESGCWTIEIHSDVLFDFDKYQIKKEALPVLDRVLAVLRNHPDVHIEIRGHTDNIGSEEYNMALSLKRAEAGKNYLIEKGPYEERITVKGCGLSQPKDSNETPEGRFKNRRIEFKVIRN